MSESTTRYILTPRQMEVVLLAYEGLTYKQIGSKLHIVWRTVQRCLTDIYKILGIKGKRQLPLLFSKKQIFVKVYKKDLV